MQDINFTTNTYCCFSSGLQPAVFAALVPNSADKLLGDVIDEIMGDNEMMVCFWTSSLIYTSKFAYLLNSSDFCSQESSQASSCNHPKLVRHKLMSRLMEL